MRRVTLANVIPFILVLGTIGLFFHKWTGGGSEAPAGITTAVSEPARPASVEGSGAQVPPGGAMNPTPAGTPNPGTPGNPPSSAMPTAPSGEPARGESAR